MTGRVKRSLSGWRMAALLAAAMLALVSLLAACASAEEPARADPEQIKSCREFLSNYDDHIIGFNYTSDEIIITYNDPIIPPSAIVADTPWLLPEADYPASAAAIAADIASLDSSFNISNVRVTSAFINDTYGLFTYDYFVRADGDFDPRDVSYALCELDKVKYAGPSEIGIPN